MKKIVLIEKNIDINETTKKILEFSGYKVFTCENGEKGIEAVLSEKPDLILCDTILSEMDGYSVLSILSRNVESSDIPFVFLSADSDFRKGMNFGADDYISKPFKESELIEAIETRLNRSEKFRNTHPEKHEVRGLIELEQLTINRKIYKYKKKEIIYREDDYANNAYFILSGNVKCIKTDGFGKEFISSVHGGGEFLGFVALFLGGENCETAITIGNTEIVKIQKEDFIKLIQNNKNVAMKFIRIISKNIKSCNNRLLNLAYTPVKERIADRILRIEKNYIDKSESSLILDISRGDLAAMVGTATETLNRMISELKYEGLIDTNRQGIIILNKSGLQKIANRSVC